MLTIRNWRNWSWKHWFLLRKIKKNWLDQMEKDLLVLWVMNKEQMSLWQEKDQKIFQILISNAFIINN